MRKSNDNIKRNKDGPRRSNTKMQSSRADTRSNTETQRISSDRPKQDVQHKRSSTEMNRSNIEMKKIEQKSSNVETGKSSQDPSSSKKPALTSPKNKQTLPPSIPNTVVQNVEEPPKKPCRKRCIDYIYNRQKKTFCERTCKDWLSIIAYSIMYLIFLSTYTLIFLFFSLLILKSTIDYQKVDKPELLTYAENGIGLTAIPTAETKYPLIWYQNGQDEDYQKYVNAIDRLLSKNRRKRDAVSSLGPCGEHPYGYGDKPCVIVKINKQLKWSGKPLQPNSTKAKRAPVQVQRWLSQDQKKLWLHCNGYHSYDKEHIGNIRYYPDPPGFDPDVFPLDMTSNSPLVAIQVSDFTLGLSLAVECKLWYDKGPSTVEFMLYVAPQDI